jgi:hypothetical protein
LCLDNVGKRDIDKLVVVCPSVGCDDTIQRQQSKEHVQTECLHAVIACKYKSVGCDVELKRKDMIAHEQDSQYHLHLAMEAINLQQRVLLSLQARVASLDGKLVLFEYQKKKEAGEKFQFPSFYTNPDGYHMALRVDAIGNGDGEGTHVSVFTLIMKGLHDAELEWPFIGKVTFTLFNQLEDKNHHISSMFFNTADNAIVGGAWGKSQFIRHSALAHDPLRNIQYLKDDTLHFKMIVEAVDRKLYDITTHTR